MNKDKSTGFDLGYACAVATLIYLHGVSAEAEHLYRENFMSLKKLKSLGADDRDIEALRPIIKEIERKNKLEAK